MSSCARGECAVSAGGDAHVTDLEKLLPFLGHVSKISSGTCSPVHSTVQNGPRTNGDTKKAVEMALSILQKCHSRMQEEGTSSSSESGNSNSRQTPRIASSGTSGPRPSTTNNATSTRPSRIHNQTIENFR